MPNLIHSLDAATLALLFDKYYHKGGSNNSIYTIHDCFAVTANNVDLLVDILKDVYIHIYSENKYLESFDNNIREFIKMNYKDVNFEENKLTVNDRVFIYPTINLVTGKELNIYPNIKQSRYLIC
jgi:DNA-directed RNA polymerase